MRMDNLDDALRDLLQEEVTREAFRLDGLEDRIVTELTGRLPRAGWIETLRRVLAPTRGVRIAQLGIVGSTAVLFLGIGILLGGRAIGWGPGAARPPVPAFTASEALMGSAGGDANAALFIMPAPGASTVTVVGNFNGWEATLLDDSDGDGIWMASIPLPPGRYEYAFVIDGRWWGQDPLADEVVRSFGDYNSVRYVGRAGDGA
jgi:hypothetical protein